MKNRCLQRYAVFLVLCVYASAAGGENPKSSVIHKMIMAVSPENLSRHISSLESSGGNFSRVSYTPGNDSAVGYILRSLESLSPPTSVALDTFFIPSASPPYGTKPLFNVVATIRGKKDPRRIFVLGAHLDSYAGKMGNWVQEWHTIRAPGADDNATGVTILLEIARIFTDTSIGFSPDYSIMFVAFGAEEYGIAYSRFLNGSEHFASSAKSNGLDILGMLNIDMIGYNSKYRYADIVSNAESMWLGEKCIEVDTLYSLGLTMNPPPFVYATYSDHSPFWNYGYPAILLIEHAPPSVSDDMYSANALYHTSWDSSGAVNIDLVARITRLSIALVATLTDQTPMEVSGEAGKQVSYSDFSNFPNPFNPLTTIQFSVPTASEVTLKIFDLLGREVTTLVQRHMDRGEYNVQWNAGPEPGGVYFGILQTGAVVSARKLTLLK